MTSKPTKSVAWYEVWADCMSAPPYLLFLWEDRDGNLEIYDPFEKRVLFCPADHQDAIDWLIEDEFTKVTGRMSEDETIVPE